LKCIAQVRSTANFLNAGLPSICTQLHMPKPGTQGTERKSIEQAIMDDWGPRADAYKDLEDLTWLPFEHPDEHEGVLGLEVAKWFGKNLYVGVVVAWTRPQSEDVEELFKIIYSDADAEDYDREQLEQGEIEFDRHRNTNFRTDEGQTWEKQRKEALLS